MGYYDNPDIIMIGVDIATLTDVFEENYHDDTGRDFDWNRDGDTFNQASHELDVLIENVFAERFGSAVAESYDDNTYVLTFWGDKNNPEDISNLEDLQGRADDTWRDNGRVNLAIYDTDFYTGNQASSFAAKWGDIGNALVDSISVGIDFPEEFDSDPMYEKVNGMSIKNSKQIKSDWEKTEMASGPIWDSPDGKWRIIEREKVRNGRHNGEVYYKLRDKENFHNDDIEFDTFEEAEQYALNSSRKITSAKSGEVDSVAADELYLCTVNDGDLYRQMTIPVIKNLQKKIKNGTYDKELALKAWLNLVTVEARKYVKEFGSRGDTIDKMFNLNTRKAAAEQVAEHYQDALNE